MEWSEKSTNTIFGMGSNVLCKVLNSSRLDFSFFDSEPIQSRIRPNLQTLFFFFLWL